MIWHFLSTSKVSAEFRNDVYTRLNTPSHSCLCSHKNRLRQFGLVQPIETLVLSFQLRLWIQTCLSLTWLMMLLQVCVFQTNTLNTSLESVWGREEKWLGNKKELNSLVVLEKNMSIYYSGLRAIWKIITFIRGQIALTCSSGNTHIYTHENFAILSSNPRE